MEISYYQCWVVLKVVVPDPSVDSFRVSFKNCHRDSFRVSFKNCPDDADDDSSKNLSDFQGRKTRGSSSF